MNKLTHSYLISSFILLTAIAFQACSPSGEGQNSYRDVDMATVAPDMSSKVFENDFVEAFVISIPYALVFRTHKAQASLVIAFNSSTWEECHPGRRWWKQNDRNRVRTRRKNFNFWCITRDGILTKWRSDQVPTTYQRSREILVYQRISGRNPLVRSRTVWAYEYQ